jgi:molybdenum cofactor cytidylyltransferase
MTRAPSFAGVILAAGESSRMGRDKALLPWRGRTLLEAHIDALRLHTDFVLVVSGQNCGELEPIADASGAFLVTNLHPERGQFSSLQVGLQEVLNRGRDAAIITLVDHPPARVETVAHLRRTFERANQGVWVVVPEYNGQHGHPIVAGREMITAFLQAPATSSARDVEHANQQHVLYEAVQDDAITQNVNTPEEYQRITQA